jgi:hypothetical protein
MSRPVSSSFSEWFLDEHISGHLLLRPSIFVGRSYKNIFSKLENHNCCSQMCEVLSRIVLFLALPIIAVLAGILFPFGLIAKGIGTCSSSNRKCEPKADEKKNHLNDSKPPLNNTVIVSSKEIFSKTHPSDEGCIFEEKKRNFEFPKKSVAPKQALGFSDMQKNHISEHAKEESNIPQVKQKSHEPISAEPYEDSSKNSGIEISFQVSSAAQESMNSIKPQANGEIYVKNDGNCLFTSFVVHKQLRQSVDVYTIEMVRKEREETVKWIRERYLTNAKIQSKLINSLSEHYAKKQDQLSEETREIQNTLRSCQQLELTSGQKQQYEMRLLEIEKENSKIENLLIDLIDANGEGVPQEEIYQRIKGQNFRSVKKWIPEYLNEMSKESVHGCAAEFYALCMRHNVRAVVHKKTKDGHFVQSPPKVRNKNGSFIAHFSYTGDHYNPLEASFS